MRLYGFVCDEVAWQIVIFLSLSAAGAGAAVDAVVEGDGVVVADALAEAVVDPDGVRGRGPAVAVALGRIVGVMGAGPVVAVALAVAGALAVGVVVACGRTRRTASLGTALTHTTADWIGSPLPATNWAGAG